MTECECNPNPAILVASLRATGYTFPTAIADIIDNSISAQAHQINIISLPNEHNPSLTIIDDGIGMSDDTLQKAMCFGSKDPLEERSPSDLGRFGLGLKTAAFSQCKILTVVSKQENIIIGYRWDLDILRKTQKWTLNKLSDEDLDNIENIQELKKLEHGTLVLLQNFDRIQDRSENFARAFSELLTDMRKHLQLVFHRFLNDNDLAIRFNGSDLQGLDPFLKTNKATQHSQEIPITFNEHRISLVIHTLPHYSKRSSGDEKMLGEDTQDKSGLYIYRNKRLITWGKWFNIRIDKDARFTRIQVDIPNALDDIWGIDIKKSSAILPEEIKNKIKQRIPSFVEPSERITTYRGKRETSPSSFWMCIVNREGKYEFSINKDNIPQLQILSEKLTPSQNQLLDNALKSIAKYLPFAAIQSHINEIDYSTIDDKERKWAEILEMIHLAKNNGHPILPLLKTLSCSSLYEQVKERILEEIRKYE